MWRWIILAILLSTTTFGEERIKLKLTPMVCLEPCTIRYSSIIPKDEGNRFWSLHWESENYEGLDERPHQGEKAPYQIVGYIPDAPAGFYSIRACVRSVKDVFCTSSVIVEVN